MSVANKIIEAPVRGLANAIAAATKDVVYPMMYPMKRVGQVQVNPQVNPLEGLAAELERSVPVILKWVLLVMLCYYGLKWLDKKLECKC